MEELVKKYEFKIEEIALIPSDGGKFEVTVGDKLVYSKLQTGRHPNPGEVDQLVSQVI
jgi:selenoprotein W-related protein